MASESLGPVDSTESLQGIYDTARKDFVERYGEPALNSLLWDAGLAGSNDLNAQILTLKYYDDAHCEDLVGDDGKQLQPIISDPTAAYKETERSYEQTSREFAATYGDMKEAELLSASGLDVGTDYESKEQVLKNYADANPVTSDEDSGDEIAPISKITIDTSYNGNQIFYNEAGVDEAVAKINTYITELIGIASDYSDVDSPLDDRPIPYSNASPRPTALSSYSGTLATTLEQAKADALLCINRIVDAIRKYNDGDASGLIDLLSGGGGAPSPSPAPTFDGDDDLDNLGDETIDELPLENQEPSFDEDEKLVIPGASSGGLSQRTSTSTDSSVSSATDETLELDDSDITSSLDSFGTSFLGADGKFFVPSASATSIKKDKVNSAGVVGAGAVLAAASLAVGGKIYYDKKSETENSVDTVDADDELIDNTEDSVEKDNKKEDEKDNVDDSKNAKDNESTFKSSSVKFKESILNDGGDF